MSRASSLRSSRIKRRVLLVFPIALAFLPLSAPRADDDNDKFQVVPFAFDPADTDLVQSAWLGGIGCPTAAATTSTGDKKPNGSFTDPACPTGDPKDGKVEGLLLAKTGPTANVAAAVAELKGLPKNLVLTELGYDIRKPGANASDQRGSHCGAGAPRFNITTTAGSFFLGCNSPPATSDAPGIGWQRLRWGGSAPLLAFNATTGQLVAVAGVVKSIEIVFDEGQDPSGGPDQFGAAVLDNIDVNRVLVGRGPEKAAQ